MSSPRSRREAISAIVLGAVALAGCTITPVHSDRALTGASDIELSFATPKSRLEQITYQTIASRLGHSSSASAPAFSARVAVAATRVGLSTRSEPAVDHQVVASIAYRVESDGELVTSGTRTATAGYRTTGQVIADDTARQRAEEDATRAASQSVIAALLSDPALR